MDAAEKQQLTAVVEGVFGSHPTPEERRKGYVATAGKGLGIVASVALTAYLSMQQAISDRPTRDEVLQHISAVQDRGDEAAAAGLKDRRASDIKVVELKGEIKALREQVSEGFSEIKEELRYLRRRSSR